VQTSANAKQQKNFMQNVLEYPWCRHGVGIWWSPKATFSTEK